MFKYLFTALLLVFSVFCSAQTGFSVAELHHVLPEPDTTEFEQVLETRLTNTSSAPITFRWVRKTLCTDPNYGNSVCIGSLCYEQTEDTRTFELLPGGFTDVSMHLWKNGPGNATSDIEVRIFPEATPANVALLTFKYGVCTIIPTTEPGQYATLNIYPNPTSRYIRVEQYDDAVSAQIFDQSGALVLSHDLNQGNQISLESLYSGTYLVRIANADGSKQSIRSFMKQ
jgi:Secretion system C-terminal sorting domain